MNCKQISSKNKQALQILKKKYIQYFTPSILPHFGKIYGLTSIKSFQIFVSNIHLYQQNTLKAQDDHLSNIIKLISQIKNSKACKKISQSYLAIMFQKGYSIYQNRLKDLNTFITIIKDHIKQMRIFINFAQQINCRMSIIKEQLQKLKQNIQQIKINKKQKQQFVERQILFKKQDENQFKKNKTNIIIKLQKSQLQNYTHKQTISTLQNTFRKSNDVVQKINIKLHKNRFYSQCSNSSPRFAAKQSGFLQTHINQLQENFQKYQKKSYLKKNSKRFNSLITNQISKTFRQKFYHKEFKNMKISTFSKTIQNIKKQKLQKCQQQQIQLSSLHSYQQQQQQIKKQQQQIQINKNIQSENIQLQPKQTINQNSFTDSQQVKFYNTNKQKKQWKHRKALNFTPIQIQQYKKEAEQKQQKIQNQQINSLSQSLSSNTENTQKQLPQSLRKRVYYKGKLNNQMMNFMKQNDQQYGNYQINMKNLPKSKRQSFFVKFKKNFYKNKTIKYQDLYNNTNQYNNNKQELNCMYAYKKGDLLDLKRNWVNVDPYKHNYIKYFYGGQQFLHADYQFLRDNLGYFMFNREYVKPKDQIFREEGPLFVEKNDQLITMLSTSLIKASNDIVQTSLDMQVQK